MAEFATKSPRKVGQVFRSRRQVSVGLLIATLAFCHAALYSFLVPIWQGPDETLHVEYVLLVAKRGVPVDPTEPDIDLQNRIVQDMLARDYFRTGFGRRPNSSQPAFIDVYVDGLSQLARPPLYPLMTSLLVSAMPEASLEVQVHAMRLFSAALFAMTALTCYQAARVVLPGRPRLALGAAAALALLPMPSFLGGMVNIDNLANLIAAAVFLVLVKAESDGYRARHMVALLVLLALGVLTKRTIFYLVPLVALTTLMALMRARGSRRRAGLIITGGLFSLGLAVLALSQPVQETVGRLADQYVGNISAGSGVANLLNRSLTLSRIAEDISNDGTMFLRSSIAAFGWVNVHVAEPWYWLGATTLLVGSVGLFRFSVAEYSKLPEGSRRGVRVLAMGLGLNLLLILAYFEGYAAADGTVMQGRYLFGALVPLAILLSAGIASLVPEGWRDRLLGPALTAIALCDTTAITSTVLPAFHG